MRCTVSGHVLELDPDAARARLAGHPPEPLNVHWVDFDGRRWPPKQALEVISGIQRASYTAHQALSVLRRLGFETSEWQGNRSPHGGPSAEEDVAQEPDDAAALRERLHEAVESLADFMGGQCLTKRISTLEGQLVDAGRDVVETIADEAEVTVGMLGAALTVRSSLGRLNDVIHAAVITLALPHILEEGETIKKRPSLAAGNNPTQLFDLETSHRVAEFKVSVWRGADAMRKRGAFADLVHLALDDSARRKQLFVVGDAPRAFLEKTTSSSRWGLTRGSAKLRDRFEARFGSVDIPISTFRATEAADIEIIDLNTVIPGLAELIGT